jgi:hypothetical protein
VTPKLKDPKDYKYLGKPARRLAIRAEDLA